MVFNRVRFCLYTKLPSEKVLAHFVADPNTNKTAYSSPYNGPATEAIPVVHDHSEPCAQGTEN
jgi:hypothetical protein